MTLDPATLHDPLFWLMAAVILAGFTPFALYLLAVTGANLRGRPVPSFAQVLARLTPGRAAPAAPDLAEIAENTRRILELLAEMQASPAPAAPPPDPQPERRAERRAPPGMENDGMDRSTAWADRRRSDRGRAARGTGYGGAEPGQTYAPGTGTRASDRPALSDEVRQALARLKLPETDLPDMGVLTRAYRGSARDSHPDRGGSTESFLEIRKAYDLVLREIGAAKKAAR